MFLRAFDHRIGKSIDISRSRACIRNDLVEHILAVEYHGHAHGVEQRANLRQLRIGRRRVFDQLGGAFPEHQRRIGHHTDNRRIRAERPLHLGERHARRNRYDQRFFSAAFAQYRQNFVKVLRLDRKQHGFARGVDLGIISRDSIAAGVMRCAFVLTAVEQQHLIPHQQSGTNRAFRYRHSHIARAQHAKTVCLHETSSLHSE